VAALEALAKSNPELAKSPQYKKLEAAIKKQDALLETAKSGGRVGFSRVPSIDELAEDAKSVASVDNKAKIAVSLVSGQLSKARAGFEGRLHPPGHGGCRSAERPGSRRSGGRPSDSQHGRA